MAYAKAKDKGPLAQKTTPTTTRTRQRLLPGFQGFRCRQLELVARPLTGRNEGVNILVMFMESLSRADWTVAC